jgi:LmbE family N-acetylglucosaminyl deacetylase
MPNHYYAVIIAPHPDDPEFGIGGTVANWVKEGH